MIQADMNDSLRRYLDDVRKTEPVDRETERELFRMARAGNVDARNRLVRAHMRFVVKVALHFRNVPLPLPDLISEGSLGLIKAIESFDESRGVKFISYAVWWIRSFIVQGIQQRGFLIRLPANQLLRLSRENKRGMTETESRDPVRGLLRAHRPDIDPDQGWQGIKPLEAYDDSDSPGERLDDFETAKRLESALEELTWREGFVIRNLYGLHQGEADSLQEVAWKLGLSVERIRQIRNKALGRLRTNGSCRVNGSWSANRSWPATADSV